MNCILQRNPLSGFINEHKRFCAYSIRGHQCEAEVTHHVNVGYWCANVCQRCAGLIREKHPSSTVSEEVYIPDVVTA